MSTLKRLRVQAISQSLFHKTTLKSAIDRAAFIQADPIRSPATAQDLILRHRVDAYQTGDLERHYPSLDIEEDLLYAYGFVSRTLWRLLQPRKLTALSKLERRILDTVHTLGQIHPDHLQPIFGRETKINAWGSPSKVTTLALEDLHYRGFLRVARRESGIRVYEPARPCAEPISPLDRLQTLALTMANIFAPAPEKSLRQILGRLRHSLPVNPRTVLSTLLQTGKLHQQTVDGLTYITPPCDNIDEEAPPIVRFLAPFDPLVWDRARFEHFWGWPYRFEAYTPANKRLRGYYAMPLLWRDRIIGWANATVTHGQLNIEVGYIDKSPRGTTFRRELDAEIQRLKTFLRLTITPVQHPATASSL